MRSRGPYLEDDHADMFIDKMVALPADKFYGVRKASPIFRAEYINFMKTKAQSRNDVFFDNNRIVTINQIVMERYVHFWYPVFTVLRQNMRTYTFSEADFPHLNIDDVEFLYNEIKEMKVRPDRVLKALDALERFIKTHRRNSEIHDFQIGLESHHKLLNLEKPNRELPNIHRYPPYVVLSKPSFGVVYLNRTGEKMFMRTDDVAKYSDGTLFLIADKLAAERTRIRMEAEQQGLFIDPTMNLDIVMRVIQYRLEYRNVMRRLESYYGLREKGT